MTVKTIWKANDYVEPEDFNRQKASIQEASVQILPALFYFPLHTGIPDANRGTLPKVSLINTLESNLRAIEDCGIPLPAEWGVAKTWIAGGPSFVDFNRWERNAKLIEEMSGLITARFPVSGAVVSGVHLLPRRVV